MMLRGVPWGRAILSNFNQVAEGLSGCMPAAKRPSIPAVGVDGLLALFTLDIALFHRVKDGGDLRGRLSIQLAYDKDGKAGEEEAGDDFV